MIPFLTVLITDLSSHTSGRLLRLAWLLRPKPCEMKNQEKKPSLLWTYWFAVPGARCLAATLLGKSRLQEMDAETWEDRQLRFALLCSSVSHRILWIQSQISDYIYSLYCYFSIEMTINQLDWMQINMVFNVLKNHLKETSFLCIKRKFKGMKNVIILINVNWSINC